MAMFTQTLQQCPVFNFNQFIILLNPPLVSVWLSYITFDVLKYPQNKTIIAEQKQELKWSFFMLA